MVLLVIGLSIGSKTHGKRLSHLFRLLFVIYFHDFSFANIQFLFHKYNICIKKSIINSFLIQLPAYHLQKEMKREGNATSSPPPFLINALHMLQ